MRTKVMIRRQVALSTIIGALMVVASAGSLRADVVTDQSGAVLIFPKIVVDTSGILVGNPTDTELQITNTSNSVISGRCVIVDTTPRCLGVGGVPDTACTERGEADGDGRCAAGSRCTPQWRKAADFQFTLTKRQPIAWRASEGLLSFPCGGPDFDPNDPGGCAFGSNTGSDGSPSSIPPVSDDPFFGEIKCAQVNPDDFTPTVGLSDGNNRGGDLTGKATVINATLPDAHKYNAIALQSTGVNDGNDELLIGGPDAEYNSCPHSLIVQHAFDEAVVDHGAAGTAYVRPSVTLAACSQDFLLDSTTQTTLQFLIFNEFEQRFSASRPFDCWADVRMVDLVPRPGNADDATSIFHVGVMGTLVGQTRIRPVPSNGRSNGVIGIVEEGWTPGDPKNQRRSSYQMNQVGVGEDGDVIVLSPNF